MSSEQILYLSAADVLACGLTPGEINAAVEAAFVASGRGEATTRPALSIPVEGGAAFRAKGGTLLDRGFGAIKWYGYFPGNAAAGIAEYRPVIVLNETATGMPLAVMNGDWITAVRTAAISAVGAKHLAPAGARSVAFIGVGGQARANLLALLPGHGIERIVACGRRRETTEAFAAFARGHGVAATVSDDPNAAIAGVEIVVSTVPRLAAATHFLDAGRLAAGAFVSMVDSGVSWDPAGIRRFSRCFADDVEQSTGHLDRGDAAATFDGSLSDVVGGARPGRISAEDRIALIFSGTGLADVAAAAAVYARARERGVGTMLAF